MGLIIEVHRQLDAARLESADEGCLHFELYQSDFNSPVPEDGIRRRRVRPLDGSDNRVQ
jgi:hypothetical protein